MLRVQHNGKMLTIEHDDSGTLIIDTAEKVNWATEQLYNTKVPTWKKWSVITAVVLFWLWVAFNVWVGLNGGFDDPCIGYHGAPYDDGPPAGCKYSP